MQNRQFIITSPTQLRSLSENYFKRNLRIGKIVIDKTFSHPDIEMLEENLNKNYYACGCDQGAKSLVIGSIIFATISALGYFHATWSLYKAALILVTGTVIMAILGKIAGLIIASVKLRYTVRKIQSVWVI